MDATAGIRKVFHYGIATCAVAKAQTVNHEQTSTVGRITVRHYLSASRANKGIISQTRTRLDARLLNTRK
jgi:hypothetical protein